jgi:TBC1 domain family member 25
VTPIRLVRKKTDSNRNSTIIIPDSDSEESDKINYKLNSTNPFFEQIQQLNASKSQTESSPTIENDLVNSCVEASEIAPRITTPAVETRSQITPVIESLPSASSTSRCVELPGPSEFGNGNPFLIFLCLTLLIQHRDYIMQNNLDYNEMAMHFDKMVRKHNVMKVLNQARKLYQDYLRRYNERVKNSSNKASK